MTKSGPIIAAIKGPDDPEARKEWAYHMMRVQVAMWVDGKFGCSWCGKVYKSVDDFLARNPKRAFTEDFQAVDEQCWASYEEARK